MQNRKHMKKETRGRHVTLITRRTCREQADKLLKAQTEPESPDEIETESEQGLPAILNEESEPVTLADEELAEEIADPDPEKEMTDVLLSAVEDLIRRQELPVMDKPQTVDAAPRELIYSSGDALPREIDSTGPHTDTACALTPEDSAGSPPKGNDPEPPASEDPAPEESSDSGEESGEE